MPSLLKLNFFIYLFTVWVSSSCSVSPDTRPTPLHSYYSNIAWVTIHCVQSRQSRDPLQSTVIKAIQRGSGHLRVQSRQSRDPLQSTIIKAIQRGSRHIVSSLSSHETYSSPQLLEQYSVGLDTFVSSLASHETYSSPKQYSAPLELIFSNSVFTGEVVAHNNVALAQAGNGWCKVREGFALLWFLIRDVFMLMLLDVLMLLDELMLGFVLMLLDMLMLGFVLMLLDVFMLLDLLILGVVS